MKEDNEILVKSVKGNRAVLFVSKPVTCSCGRSSVIVVNRDGQTRCIHCDTMYQFRGVDGHHEQR